MEQGSSGKMMSGWLLNLLVPGAFSVDLSSLFIKVSEGGWQSPLNSTTLWPQSPPCCLLKLSQACFSLDRQECAVAWEEVITPHGSHRVLSQGRPRYGHIMTSLPFINEEFWYLLCLRLNFAYSGCSEEVSNAVVVIDALFTSIWFLD